MFLQIKYFLVENNRDEVGKMTKKIKITGPS